MARQIHRALLRLNSFFLRPTKSVPKTPKPGRRVIIAFATYPLGGAVDAALMVNVDDEALDPGEMLLGLKAHVKPAGAEQDNEICPLNPPAGLALTMTVAEPPCATVALWADRFREKSGLPTAAAGTILANTAVALPPAGKLG